MKNLLLTVLGAIAASLFSGPHVEAQTRRAFADYFTFLHSRTVSGSSSNWQLYDAPSGPSDSGYYPQVRWSGDVYLTADKKEISGSVYPLIEPYGAADPHVIEYHVLSAIAAGIDGFIFEWIMTGQILAPTCNDDSFGVRSTQSIADFAAYGQPFGFEVGVNWTCSLTETYKLCYGTAPRNEYLDQAAWDLDYVLDNIYSIAGIHVGGRPVVLVFQANSFVTGGTSFHPNDLLYVRNSPFLAGHDPILLTNAWQPIDLEMLQRDIVGKPTAADGFFTWKKGSSSSTGFFPWTHTTTVQGEVDYRLDFVAQCAAENAANPLYPISYMMSAVPRFDDHKGRAWGSGDKRYTPSADATGNTLEETLATWPGSGTDLAFLVTWNDTEEATIVEPSREFGYENLDDCLTGIAAWKGLPPPTLTDHERLRLPERLFRVRKAIALVESAIAKSVTGPSQALQDYMDDAIASADAAASKLGLLQSGASSDLSAAEASAGSALNLLHVERIDFTWTWTNGATNPAMQACGTVTPWPDNPPDGRQGAKVINGVPLNLDIKGSVADAMSTGAFVGRMTVEFLEADDSQPSYADSLRVVVDAPAGTSSFSMTRRSKESDAWQELQCDLVNGQWSSTCGTGQDVRFSVSNPVQGATTAVHHLRVEGFVYQVL